MSGIKLPIEVGQKFLSDGTEIEIISVTGRYQGFPVIDNYGNKFSANGIYFEEEWGILNLQPIPEPEIVIPEGVDFKVTSEAMRKKCLELQESGRRFTREGIHDDYCSFDSTCMKYKMLPITITEGVEFRGEAYRAEFERLVKEGREFDRLGNNAWDHAGGADFSPDHQYRLRPQHRDAIGNTLKVGDRVKYEGQRYEIEGLDQSVAYFPKGVCGCLKNCRKLTTRTRPLRKQDLIDAASPAFLNKFGSIEWPSSSNDVYVKMTHGFIRYDLLTESGWRWRPSADQAWQPCEVTEEVLA